ncbi:MAG TPA: thermonuclease family protein, partial [Kiloniellales bacterium]|nr:thermonuclease family protein [Kiloniellales bacterium]
APCAAAASEDLRARLAPGEGGTVAGIVDGDTLVLADGREIRLVGIQAPKLPLGREGFVAWPLAEEARAALSGLALGKHVRLGYGGRRGDRHGRVLAHLFGPDGAWLQGTLLERGFARVYGFADNRALLPEMLARERAARAARRGIWRHAFYAVRNPAEAAGLLGRFELVEGRVVDAAVVRGRAYLNFGPDWRTDFTVVLDPPVRRLFESEGIDPLSYRGQRVRVRGWLESYNGPMIEATHPEQIEVLGP